MRHSFNMLQEPLTSHAANPASTSITSDPPLALHIKEEAIQPTLQDPPHHTGYSLTSQCLHVKTLFTDPSHAPFSNTEMYCRMALHNLQENITSQWRYSIPFSLILGGIVCLVYVSVINGIPPAEMFNDKNRINDTLVWLGTSLLYHIGKAFNTWHKKRHPLFLNILTAGRTPSPRQVMVSRDDLVNITTIEQAQLDSLQERLTALEDQQGSPSP